MRDTGTGMNPEVLERAFEPFFTTKGVDKGTGLGLSMVYGVARQSGGEARIESAPGEGTAVTIELRRVAGPAAEPKRDAPGAERQVARGGGETVLVVDDDEDVRATLRHSLESLGYRVEEAENGPEALVLVQQAAPALAILDYPMPEMNGAELARRARALRPDLRIVFASGYAETDALERALGADTPVLRKPFAVADVVAATLARDRAGEA